MDIEMKKNLVKNILIILIMILSYCYIRDQIASIPSDPIFFQTFLIAVSMLLLCAMFGNFTFRYKLSAKSDMMLGHLVTGLSMLAAGLMFEILAILINIPIFTILSVIMYVGLMAFDFWDLNQMK